MSKIQRLLLAVSALLMAASLAVAGPLPLSVLGPDNPQVTQVTAVPNLVCPPGFNCGGMFTGTVGGNPTELWCVDSQRLVYQNQAVPASVHLISSLGAPGVDPEVRSSTVTGSGWKYYGSDSALHTAQQRYTAAAWLIESYTPGMLNPANILTNQEKLKVIWSLLYVGTGGQDPGDQSASPWLAAAKAALQNGYQAAHWAVLSWGVYATGSSIGDLDPRTPRQTLLVRVVPEPGFYGLLGLGLSTLIFLARRRQSAAS